MLEFKPKLKENRWSSKLEKIIQENWEREKIFKFDLRTDKQIFTIDTPPPYPRSA